MTLEQVFPPRGVLLDLGILDKAHVISGMAKLLASSGGPSGQDIESALLAREGLGSTGVGGGIALPHARLRSLGQTRGVFVRLATPIDFDAIDGKPVDLICAVVAPDKPNAALLMTVAALSRVLRDGDSTTALRKTHDAAEARRILTGVDG